ncbi:MAG: putative bifunctional diguanylate cyclase/phosphodiesterase [Pseudomonadota bacterium]
MISSFVMRMEQYGPVLKLTILALILLLIPGITWMVHQTGGIKFVYSHTMYIPLVLSALAFGVRGAIPVALIAALALGPLMPVDTATGEMQNTANWLYRMAIFVLVAAIVGSASDLIRLYLQRIQWRLYHDPATELPNRNALLNDLDTNLRTEPDRDARQALILINLDDLQDYELRLGSHFSTLILRQLHDRCRMALGDGVRVYQAGQNQIALLADHDSAEITESILRSLDSLMLEPFHFDDIPVLLSFHSGTVHTRELVLGRAEEYLQKAELCISRALQIRQRHVTYEEILDSISRENIEMLGRFKQAFDEQRLFLHFQPKIRLADGGLAGSEALLRWRTADGRYISPAYFIPRVEKSSLIHTLSHWVIEQGLLQHQAWRSRGLECGRIAINISPANLQSRHFVTDVLHLMDRHGVDPDILELEVTETAFMDDIQQSARKLHLLAREGVHISIDDYGTGYSSLQYLDRLPVSTLKLDRVFINRLGIDSARHHLVGHTINLAHALGMTVIAEGVETPEVANMLKAMDCELAQGFHFSRPLPPEQFERFCVAA